MIPHDLPADTALSMEGAALLSPLLNGRTAPAQTAAAASPALPHPVSAPQGVIVGELLAISENGSVPLVRFAGQSAAGAIPARSVVDLHAAHIGQSVVLLFENADPRRPIVMGVVRESTNNWPLAEAPAQLEVDSDGQRMLINAREQLVLRCGKARITLTKAGKVLIEGSHVVSRSSGANRVQGGSVQLN